MDLVIWGLEPDITGYTMAELSFYLLIWASLMVLTGKYLEKNRIEKEYFKLVRLGSLPAWWRRLYLRLLAISCALAVLLFLASVILGEGGVPVIYGRKWPEVFVLWLTGFFSVNLLQALIINKREGYKIGFLLCMTVIVNAVFLNLPPGNFLMPRRSDLAALDGYPAGAVILIQVLIDFTVYRIGYRVFSPGRKRRAWIR